MNRASEIFWTVSKFVSSVSKGEEKEMDAEKNIYRTAAEYSLNLIKDTNLQIKNTKHKKHDRKNTKAYNN